MSLALEIVNAWIRQGRSADLPLQQLSDTAASIARNHLWFPDWEPIATEPSDGSRIWLTDGVDVWLGTAHEDGSLKDPSRSKGKFWTPAVVPAPPLVIRELGDGVNPWDSQ
jgi:hypothetical protein